MLLRRLAPIPPQLSNGWRVDLGDVGHIGTWIDAVTGVDVVASMLFLSAVPLSAAVQLPLLLLSCREEVVSLEFENGIEIDAARFLCNSCCFERINSAPVDEYGVGGDTERLAVQLPVRFRLNDDDEGHPECLFWKHFEYNPRPSLSANSQPLDDVYGKPLSNISNWPRLNSVHPSSFVNGLVVMTAIRSLGVVKSAKSTE